MTPKEDDEADEYVDLAPGVPKKEFLIDNDVVGGFGVMGSTFVGPEDSEDEKRGLNRQDS